MAKIQTRMRSNERRSIVLAHTSNIKPAGKSFNAGVEIDSLRHKGNLVASHMNAVLARRASFHVA